MGVPPRFNLFPFFAMNHFDWPITKQKKTLEVPQNRIYIERWSASPSANFYSYIGLSPLLN